MKKRHWLFLIALIIAGLVIFYPFILTAAAKRLVVSDALKPADLIIILAGDDNGERVNEGVKLFKEGYASKILVSGGPLAWRLTYAAWMKKQAVELGVPARSIWIQDRSRSTIEDAKFSLPIVEKLKCRSVIIVTSPTHSRRAGIVFRKIFSPAGIKVVVRSVAKSEFDPDRWWTRHEDTNLVVWEYVSSVLYFFKGY